MQRIGLAVVRALSVVLAPLTDEAQQPGKVYRIGVLTTSSGRRLVNEPSSPYRAFLQALRELGYTAAAAELARLHVDVIVAAGPVLAGLKEARLAIPVVMTGSPYSAAHYFSLPATSRAAPGDLHWSPLARSVARS